MKLVSLAQYSLFVIACMCIGACENDPGEVAALFADERPDAEIITEFETIYSDSAQIKVRISGPKLLRLEEGGDLVQRFPDGVLVEFFDDQRQVSSTLRAGFGIRYERAERVVVRDSVVWLAINGDRLDTEELIWEATEQRIYSDRYVRLRQGDKEITGVGFESNQNFTRSKVRAIQGVISIEQQP